MWLSDEAVQEFKTLYLRRFGVLLGDDDAREEAAKVIALVASLQPEELNNGQQMAYNNERKHSTQ